LHEPFAPRIAHWFARLPQEDEEVDTTTTAPPPINDYQDKSLYAEPDEFQVIGLRPSEFRPAVIRRAMHRSAVPLASLHLNQPDRGVEMRLARVVTSGYRLLDPRRREDSIQRMMLGRIHPQLADEAARMAQSKGQSLIAADDGNVLEFEPFIEGSLLSQQPKDNRPVHLAGDSYFIDVVDNPWSDSLRSDDLLLERPHKRLIRSSKRWLSRHFLTLGTAAGFLLVTLATWRVFKDTSKQPLALLPTKVAAADTALNEELLNEESTANEDFESLCLKDDVLMGRVLIDGKDTGVLLAYELGAPLTEDLVLGTSERMDDVLSTATVELHGTIELDGPGTIRLSLPTLVAESFVAISIDGHVLEEPTSTENDPSTSHYRVELEKATSTIHLSVSPEVGELPLRIVDDQSGLPIRIKKPVAGGKNDPMEIPTQVRVAVRSDA
jgi:hypothetical protein